MRVGQIPPLVFTVAADLTEISFGLSFFTVRTGIGTVLGGGGASVFVSSRTRRGPSRKWLHCGFGSHDNGLPGGETAEAVAAGRPRRKRQDATGICGCGRSGHHRRTPA